MTDYPKGCYTKRQKEEYDKLNKVEQLCYEPSGTFGSIPELLKELYADELEGLVYHDNPFLKMVK